jgi:hypothetical protein
MILGKDLLFFQRTNNGSPIREFVAQIVHAAAKLERA